MPRLSVLPRAEGRGPGSAPLRGDQAVSVTSAASLRGPGRGASLASVMSAATDSEPLMVLEVRVALDMLGLPAGRGWSSGCRPFFAPSRRLFDDGGSGSARGPPARSPGDENDHGAGSATEERGSAAP